MRKAHAGGFTLIDTLAALLVLALGIGGAALAQWTALRTRHGSSLTSQATELASSLADRMRAHAASMRGGGPNPYVPFSYDAAREGAPPAPAACFGAGACTAAQMAQFDLDEVRLVLHQRFPGGRIVVCRDAGPAALSWECEADGQGPWMIKIGWRASGSEAAEAIPMVALALEERP